MFLDARGGERCICVKLVADLRGFSTMLAGGRVPRLVPHQPCGSATSLRLPSCLTVANAGENVLHSRVRVQTRGGGGAEGNITLY